MCTHTYALADASAALEAATLGLDMINSIVLARCNNINVTDTRYCDY